MALLCHPFLFFNAQANEKHFDFSQDRQAIYQNLLKLKTNEVSSSIEENYNFGQNGIDIYLKNMLDIISVITNDTKANYDVLKKNEDKYLDQLKDFPAESEYRRFIMAEIKLTWAFVKLNFNDEASAFFDFRSAYRLITQNYHAHPSFKANKKTLGMIHIIIGSIPSEYQWLTNTLGFKGDVATGKTYLKAVASSQSIFNHECKLMEALLTSFLFKKEEKGIQKLESLYEANPDNLLFNFVLASLYYQARKNDQALEVMLARPNSSAYASIPVFDFFIAETYLNKLNFEKAEAYYDQFLKNYQGANHIHATRYKLFVIKHLQDKEKDALKELDKIDVEQKNVTYPDRYAQHFAEKREIPSKSLMKARLLTDGGYLEQALAELLSNAFYSKRKDKVEYYYRLARVYHYMHIPTKAVTYYQKTINESRYKDPWYFAANANLQLGYLYRNSKPAKAKIFFKEVSEYKNHIYKNSLKDKAKFELDQLNESRSN